MSANRKVGVEIFVTAGQAKEEFANTKENIKVIGDEAENANNRAKVATEGLNSSAKTQAAAFGATSAAATGASKAISQNELTLKSNQATIKSNAVEIAQLNQKLTELKNTGQGGSDAAKVLTQQIATLSAQTKVASAENGLLSVAVKTEKEAAEAATSAWSRKTSMINTGQGALRGYDAVIQAVVRSFGGIAVGWAVALQVGSALLPLLLNLGGAKRELATVTKELIESDALLAELFARVSAAGGQTNTTIKDQAALYRQLLQIDLFAQLVAIEDQYKKVAEANQKAADVQNSFKQDQLEHAKIQDILTGKQEANGQSLDRLRTRMEALEVLYEGQRMGIANTDAARGKEEDTLNSLIVTLQRFANLTHMSTAELMAHARSVITDTGALARLEAQLDATALAARRFTDALNDQKIAGVETMNTSAGITKATQDLRTQLAGTERAILNTAGASATLAQQQYAKEQAFRANLPAIKQLAEAEIKYRETTAVLGGQVKKTKEITEEYKQTLRQSNDELSQAKLRALELEEAHKKGAKASGAGAAAARAYANALVDLRKRAEDAESALTLDTLSLQQERNRNQIQSEREHLEINKRDKAAALALLDRIERAMLAKTLQDAAELRYRSAIQQSQNYVRVLRNADLEHRQNHFRVLKQIEADEEAHNNRLLQLFLNRIARQEAKAIAKAEGGLASSDAARAGREAEIHEGAERELEKIGKAFGFVHKEAKEGSVEMRIFNLQLSALEKFEAGDVFGGIVDGIHAVSLELIRSGQLFTSFFSAIADGFAAAIGGTESFSDALKASMLNALAAILEYWGSAAIALGSAYLFIPGMHGAGVALIAAGGALLVLAGVIHGYASTIGRDSAGAGGASAAASGGSGAGETSRAARGPNVIEFPTSAANPNLQRLAEIDRMIEGLHRLEHGLFAVSAHRLIERLSQERGSLPSSGRAGAGSGGSSGTTYIQLDPQGTKDFLDGKKVLTADSIKGRHKRVVQRVTKKKVA